jgi:hypothetical protein
VLIDCTGVTYVGNKLKRCVLVANVNSVVSIYLNAVVVLCVAKNCLECLVNVVNVQTVVNVLINKVLLEMEFKVGRVVIKWLIYSQAVGEPGGLAVNCLAIRAIAPGFESYPILMRSNNSETSLLVDAYT